MSAAWRAMPSLLHRSFTSYFSASAQSNPTGRPGFPTAAVLFSPPRVGYAPVLWRAPMCPSLETEGRAAQGRPRFPMGLRSSGRSPSLRLAGGSYPSPAKLLPCLPAEGHRHRRDQIHCSYKFQTFITFIIRRIEMSFILELFPCARAGANGGLRPFATILAISFKHIHRRRPRPAPPLLFSCRLCTLFSRCGPRSKNSTSGS